MGEGPSGRARWGQLYSLAFSVYPLSLFSYRHLTVSRDPVVQMGWER